jgi:hypothetical protein
MIDYFIANDPDVRNSAYAVIDPQGDLVHAWVVKASSIEDSALKHSQHVPELPVGNYMCAVESQQFYGNTPRDRVKSLLQLSRACGISMAYLAQHTNTTPQLVLPRHWTKGREKSVNQYWIISDMGMTPVRHKGKSPYCHAKELEPKFKATEQKHIIDSLGIAQYIRLNHQRELKLEKYR